MSEFRIVYGTDKETGKSRDFMERNYEGVLTYHNYKRRVRKWGIKYGAYSSIKQHPGEAHFFDVGRNTYNVDVIKEIELIDSKTVCVGYTSVDRLHFN